MKSMGIIKHEFHSIVPLERVAKLRTKEARELTILIFLWISMFEHDQLCHTRSLMGSQGERNHRRVFRAEKQLKQRLFSFQVRSQRY
jgi:hypothetical protein